MINLLNPKDVSFQITLTNEGRKKLKNVEVNIKRIDDDFPEKSFNTRSKTDNNGFVDFGKIKEGGYLIQIHYRKLFYEFTQELDNDYHLNLKLHTRFGFGKKEIRVPSDVISQLYYKYRSDTKYCYKCKIERDLAKGWWKCKECNRHYCPDCRLPENHNCIREFSPS